MVAVAADEGSRSMWASSWARWGSNPRPSDYESPALTTELQAQVVGSGGGTRTHNLRLNRELLCRLSYPGTRKDQASSLPRAPRSPGGSRNTSTDVRHTRADASCCRMDRIGNGPVRLAELGLEGCRWPSTRTRSLRRGRDPRAGRGATRRRRSSISKNVRRNRRNRTDHARDRCWRTRRRRRASLPPPRRGPFRR